MFLVWTEKLFIGDKKRFFQTPPSGAPWGVPARRGHDLGNSV